MRRWIVVVVVFGLLVLLVLLFGREAATPDDTPHTSRPNADSRTADPGVEREVEAEVMLDPEVSGEDSTGEAFLDMDRDVAVRWSQVDLEAVREAMPDNLFWTLGAPTTDPGVERERAEERARWNEAYGKVLSGTASEDEIHAYYEQRHRLSADYVEFARHLLESYGDVLPARDVGLLDLSVKMHHARLQQMPRRLTEALERKHEQDRLREAWLADEAAFEQAQSEEVERARR